jgi:mono/diheme cytochrome c family protein
MPRKYWAWGLLVGAAALFVGFSTANWSPPVSSKSPLGAATPKQVARGEALYRLYCLECHGEQAQGENPLLPQGGVKDDGRYLAPALNARGHAHHHSPDVLLGYLRNGSPAVDSTMRSFRSRLSEEDMHDVLGYVWTLWPEPLQRAYIESHGL